MVAGGTAVLGGRLYVVAGCGGNCMPASQATYVYDPQADTWSQVADYPITDSWLSCAGIDGQVVCAGGTDPITGAELAATYAFDPITGAWTQRADLPYPNWAMASADSGGRLQLVGGVSGGQLTNQTEEYDPVTNCVVGSAGRQRTGIPWQRRLRTVRRRRLGRQWTGHRRRAVARVRRLWQLGFRRLAHGAAHRHRSAGRRSNGAGHP